MFRFRITNESFSVIFFSYILLFSITMLHFTITYDGNIKWIFLLELSSHITDIFIQFASLWQLSFFQIAK